MVNGSMIKLSSLQRLVSGSMVKKTVSFTIGQSKPLNENVSMIDGPAVALANPCFRSTNLVLASHPVFRGYKLTVRTVLVPRSFHTYNSIDLDRIDWQKNDPSINLDDGLLPGKFLRVYS